MNQNSSIFLACEALFKNENKKREREKYESCSKFLSYGHIYIMYTRV